MTEHLVTLLTLAFLIGALGLIAYREKDAAVRFAFATLTLCALIRPISDFVREAGEFSVEIKDEDISDEEYVSYLSRAVEDGIRDSVCDEFSLKPEDVTVKVDGLDPKSMRCERVRIFISPRAMTASVRDIEKYIKKLGFGECDAEFELG